MRVQQAWIDDVPITNASAKIILQHIEEKPLELSQVVANRPYGGQYLVSNQPTKREIVLHFAIKEGLDFESRLSVYQAVCSWCKSGWLRLSDHPGQRIYVHPIIYPDLGKLRDWADDLSVTFAAYWFPYWQAISPTELTSSGTSGSLSIPKLGGTYNGILDLSITPASDSLTSLTIRTYCNTTTKLSDMYFSLTLSPVSAGQTLTFAHDERGLLTVVQGGTGLLGRRSIASSDDLLLLPGVSNRIYYSANTVVSVTARYREAWI